MHQLRRRGGHIGLRNPFNQETAASDTEIFQGNPALQYVYTQSNYNQVSSSVLAALQDAYTSIVGNL
jgi:hypothetical protein